MKPSMRIVLPIIFLLLMSCLCIGITLYIQPQKPKEFTNYQTTLYTLEGRKLFLIVADDANKWTKGLMFVERNFSYDGMLFVFPNKQYRTFWNKNTLLDLDLYWINDGTVVGKSFLPSINKSKTTVTVNSPGKADKVIEVIKR